MKRRALICMNGRLELSLVPREPLFLLLRHPEEILIYRNPLLPLISLSFN